MRNTHLVSLLTQSSDTHLFSNTHLFTDTHICMRCTGTVTVLRVTHENKPTPSCVSESSERKLARAHRMWM